MQASPRPGADGFDAGARNLLQDCAGVTEGTRLLILAEPETDTYYDPALATDLAQTARDLGAIAEVLRIPFNPVVTDPDPALARRMDAADRVIFLARLGDQLRFRPSLSGNFAVMSYALDRAMLASRFGRVPYAATVALKTCLNDALAGAAEIRVTCPAGTDFKGPGARFPGAAGETTVRRFPLSVFSPVPPTGFAGRVAQVGFLCGTGSMAYDPPACEITETLFVHFDGHRIIGFEGTARDVVAAEAHYAHVARLFDLEERYIHSWHGGIHPGCAYDRPANDWFDRWSNGAFGNPRLLHFHTCGMDPPGEISLNIVDPTVRLDGVAVWEGGVLHPERIKGGAELLAQWPALAQAFENPARAIGTDLSGRLQF